MNHLQSHIFSPDLTLLCVEKYFCLHIKVQSSYPKTAKAFKKVNFFLSFFASLLFPSDDIKQLLNSNLPQDVECIQTTSESLVPQKNEAWE